VRRHLKLNAHLRKEILDILGEFSWRELASRNWVVGGQINILNWRVTGRFNISEWLGNRR